MSKIGNGIERRIESNYIDFMGSPGAGKSTLHQELVQNKNIYGYRHQRVQRYVKEKLPIFAANIYANLPSTVRNRLNNIIRQRPREFSFQDFLIENPDFIHLASEVEGSCNKSGSRFRFLRKGFTNLKFTQSMAREKEIMCVDEAFSQVLLSSYANSKNPETFLDSYFDTLPNPFLVIHVDTNKETCINRIRKRSRKSNTCSKENLRKQVKKYRENCINIKKEIRERGIKVITINNNDALEDVTEQLTQKVKKECKRQKDIEIRQK